MYIINNKMESVNLIKNLHLNVLPEKIFNHYNKKEIEIFIAQFPADFYAVRDKTISMSKKYKLAVPKEEVVDYCKNLEKFSINVSSFNYSKNQLLCGEIKINENMDVDYILSTNPNFSLRDCYQHPDFVGKVSVFDNKYKIDGLEKIIEYALKYNLIGVIIEFTLFNKKLGINNDNVVIWELRSNY